VDTPAFPKSTTMAVEYTTADVGQKDSCILYVMVAEHEKLVKYQFTPNYKMDEPSQEGL
jgi:hypothetical protein